MEMSVQESAMHQQCEDDIERECIREKQIKHARTYTSENRKKYDRLKRIQIIIPKHLSLHGKQLSWDNSLRKVALECVQRQWKQKQPNGRYWQGSIWKPCECERASCCENLRVSRDFPFTLLAHCRTTNHIATLYQVDPSDLHHVIKQVKIVSLTINRIMDE